MKKKEKSIRDKILDARALSAARWNEAKEKAGEEGRVKYLLTLFNIAKKKSTLLELHKSRTGNYGLTLADFNEMCPTFPLLMGYAPVASVNRLHLDSKATLPALFRNFTAAPFYKAYEAFYEQSEAYSGGRAVALLFNRKGVRQGLVMHDDNGLGDYWRKGTELTYTGGDRENPVRLVVQPFASLAESIYNKGNGWRPEFAF